VANASSTTLPMPAGRFVTLMGNKWILVQTKDVVAVVEVSALGLALTATKQMVLSQSVQVGTRRWEP